MRQRRKPRWYATERGKKYHEQWCMKVNEFESTLLPVTERDISARRLTPCSECKPTPPLRSVQ